MLETIMYSYVLTSKQDAAAHIAEQMTSANETPCPIQTQIAHYIPIEEVLSIVTQYLDHDHSSLLSNIEEYIPQVGLLSPSHPTSWHIGEIVECFGDLSILEVVPELE